MLNFAAQLVLSGTLTVALTAGIVWLSKSWISERLKSAIKHEYDQKLESHKAQLQAQSAVETERLRSQLSVQAAEHAVRFQKLHEKRAEVVAEVYSRLVEAYWKASSFASMMEWVGEPNKKEKYVEAMNSIASFYQYFDKHKIYLPSGLCDQIESFVQGMRHKIIGFGVYVRHADESLPEHALEKKHEAWTKAWEYMEKEVPAARSSLESELRSILGGPSGTGG
jgi:hypothetical protein